MLKIAVVDDEIVFVESLINKITAVCENLNLKFKIDKYSNAFAILENYSKYHLIFLDIEMPSIDGIATAKRINKLKGSAEIPFIVYVTSHDELVFELPTERLDEAVAFIRACMEQKPFSGFDVPIMAEAAYGADFGHMTEIERSNA